MNTWAKLVAATGLWGLRDGKELLQAEEITSQENKQATEHKSSIYASDGELVLKNHKELQTVKSEIPSQANRTNQSVNWHMNQQMVHKSINSNSQ